MFKILKIEFQQYIKEPLMYGFFLLPIVLLIIFSLALPKPDALASVIFVQISLVSSFVYGNKVMVYRNDTLRKKVNNSSLKRSSIISALIIINVLFILLSLMVPIMWVMMTTHSASWAYDNQWWFFATSTGINTALAKGLDQNMLLFNSNLFTWFQFILAYAITNAICISFSHMLAFSSKDEVRYFSLSIILSILIILISNVFTKDMFVMTDGAYVQNSMTIKNGMWKTIRNLNPFYWTNQLLTNTIVADMYSGSYESGEVMTGIFTNSGAEIIMEGFWTPVYYNIFHIGTNADPNINIARPIFVEGCEIAQILTLASPMIFTLSFASVSLLLMEVNK